MSITNCPNCNSPVPPGSIFCDNCGFDLRNVASGGQGMASAAQSPEKGESGVTCPTCGHFNISGSAFCENCGTQLPQAMTPPPQAMTPPAPAYEPPKPPEPQAAPPAPAYTPPAAPPPMAEAPATSIQGKLVIQSSNATLTIPGGKQVIVIGREDPVSGIFPDIDLDPYGAQEEGVGRRHAQLVLRGGDVYLEDLDSVNGTVVNKQRLAPRRPEPIKDGDELRLGKMVIIYKNG
jgi:hypothetical protein